MSKLLSFLTVALLLFTGCSSKNKNTLKVAATPVPHAQMLEYIKPDLEKEGIDLVIIEVDDYNIPNRALAYHEIDANFFQHIPFLDEQIKQFHYAIESYAKIEIEPMGMYSKKIHSLADLKDGATIAIPNDPTNEARALLLLQQNGIIQLDNPNNFTATIVNIKQNPKNLKFQEIDAPMLPRTLNDVDGAIIPTNFALQAGFVPSKDAIIIENSSSPYVNVIAIRIGDENQENLISLKKAMTSDKMRAYILAQYHGAIIPAF